MGPSNGGAANGTRTRAPPRVTHEIVRSRVLRLLDQRWEHLVTTLTAGPGFGKSIAVGQALRGNHAVPRGVEAWLSCRSGCEEPERLVHEILRGFDTRDTASELHGPPLAQLQQLVADMAPIDVGLVLDDVEALTAAPACVELLDQLLRAAPWNLHVVLSGRELPPVALARLRAAEQVVEISEDDLRFSPAEITALAGNVGAEAPQRDLGGWPALVRLAVAAPVGAVGDFLWEELIQTLTVEDRRALLAACILGPASDADIEEVCGERFDAPAFCSRVPLVHEAEGQIVAHDLWGPFVAGLASDDERAALSQRAMEVVTSPGDVVATGTLAIRLGDAAALRRASVALVRATLTNLPVDLAAAWLAAAATPTTPVAAATGADDATATAASSAGAAVTGTADISDRGGEREPETELLACALAHARKVTEPPVARLDELMARFRDRGDLEGETVTLALAAIVADANDDTSRLPVLALRAQILADTHPDPILRLLTNSVGAAITAAGGDLAGALELLEQPIEGLAPHERVEAADRLRWRLLLLVGRAADAAELAASLGAASTSTPITALRRIPATATTAPSVPTVTPAQPPSNELEAVARWLDGDPSGFTPIRAELGRERYAALGERDRFDHASFVAVLAAATGDPAPVDLAVDVLTSSLMAEASPPHRARVAVARANQRVVHHDDAGAATVIEQFVDEHPSMDPITDAFLRRSLGVPYVCSPRLRARWDTMALGPSQDRARAIARLLVDARAGRALVTNARAGRALAGAGQRFAAGARRTPDARARQPVATESGPTPVPVASVCTVLPLPWSVELAARAAACGASASWGASLAEELADRFGPQVVAELDRGLTAEDAAVRLGSERLRDLLPSTPPNTVEIRVLGPLEIWRDGAAVTRPELRRTRVRELLSALVVERTLTRDRVIDLLWPDLDPARARANLRVTLSHLQRLLEPDRGDRAPYFVRADAEHLRLREVAGLTVDLWAAERDLAQADAARRAGNPAARARHLEAATDRWHDRPLPDLDRIPRLSTPGLQLTSRLVDACLTYGELELIRGALSSVIRCVERVLAADPYQERAHRLAIAVHLQARDRAATGRAVARLHEMLDELGVAPDETTQILLRQANA